MLTYPAIDPVALRLGPVVVHWYGLMYLLGFSAAFWLGNRRATQPNSPITPEQVADVIFWGAIGVILGGRFGYVLFYDFNFYWEHPNAILQIWRGGMSFHGGMLGVLFSIWLYQRQQKIEFFRLSDFIVPLVPIGLGAGRIGNFINAELVGKPTDLPWGMVFPNAGSFSRHPSQLYEAFLEGLVLFWILWLYSKKPRPVRSVSGVFLIGYGFFRFIVVFARSPDPQVGYLAWEWLTMGQVLSFPMILAGIFIFSSRKRIS
ncbi:Phosphatidylglycerol--prolipoprotein diacylglyceryl transferase [Gammaproteobacteria bacterium]